MSQKENIWWETSKMPVDILYIAASSRKRFFSPLFQSNRIVFLPPPVLLADSLEEEKKGQSEIYRVETKRETNI